MTRYIDGDHLKSWILARWAKEPNSAYPLKASEILYQIDREKEYPIVDEVPVIRCKDCKHMSNEIDQRDGSDVFVCNFNRWRRMEGKHRDDFYCADGERKEK